MVRGGWPTTGVKRTGRCLTPPAGNPAASKKVGVARDLDVGQALKKLAEGNRHLPAGQVGAEAEVRSRAAEADVGIGLARDVEPLRIGETRGGHGWLPRRRGRPGRLR